MNTDVYANACYASSPITTSQSMAADITVLQRNTQGVALIDMNDSDYYLSIEESQKTAIVIINPGDGTKNIYVHDATGNPALYTFFIYGNSSCTLNACGGNFTGTIDPLTVFQFVYAYTAGTFINYVTYDPLTLLTPGSGNQFSFNKFGCISQVKDSRTVTSLSIDGGTVTIDCSLGDYFTCLLSQNITAFAFTNTIGAGKAMNKTIRFIQDPSTPSTVTFPYTFLWDSGAVGVISAGLNAIDRLTIISDNNGSTWDCTLVNNLSQPV